MRDKQTYFPLFHHTLLKETETELNFTNLENLCLKRTHKARHCSLHSADNDKKVPCYISMECDLNNNDNAFFPSRTGEIFSLYFGSKLVVFLNSYDVMYKAFVKHGDTLSDRPPTTFMVNSANFNKGLQLFTISMFSFMLCLIILLSFLVLLPLALVCFLFFCFLFFLLLLLLSLLLFFLFLFLFLFLVFLFFLFLFSLFLFTSHRFSSFYPFFLDVDLVVVVVSLSSAALAISLFLHSFLFLLFTVIFLFLFCSF